MKKNLLFLCIWLVVGAVALVVIVGGKVVVDADGAQDMRSRVANTREARMHTKFLLMVDPSFNLFVCLTTLLPNAS